MCILTWLSNLSNQVTPDFCCITRRRSYSVYAKREANNTTVVKVPPIIELPLTTRNNPQDIENRKTV